MPTARKKTTRRSGSGPAAAAKRQGDASLERLIKSLEVAQKALNDLRKELGRGGRDLVGELRKDLGQLGDTIAGRGGGSKRATGRTGAAKRKTAKRSTAKKSTAKRKTAKRAKRS